MLFVKSKFKQHRWHRASGPPAHGPWPARRAVTAAAARVAVASRALTRAYYHRMAFASADLSCPAPARRASGAQVRWSPATVPGRPVARAGREVQGIMVHSLCFVCLWSSRNCCNRRAHPGSSFEKFEIDRSSRVGKIFPKAAENFIKQASQISQMNTRQYH
jgi:hypothetical protein